MSRFLDLTTRHYVDLLQAFLTAVDALNNQDITKVESLLDDDIVLNRIHHLHDADIVRGKGKVVNFLSAKVNRDKPQLMPISPISVDSRTGTVSGLAIWEDHQEGTTKEAIKYSFIFTLAPDGAWRIHNLSASLH
jgi:hypothetical protein